MPNLVTGSISTLGGAVAAPISGAYGISVTISGTWTDTLSFQASYDGGNTWHNIALAFSFCRDEGTAHAFILENLAPPAFA